jgi:hypothetical protein
MLRYLNQDQFFNGLRVYRDSFDYATANTEDLERIMGRQYGADLGWFFDEWVYGQGYPEYNVYWYCVPSAGNYQIQLRIHQDQTNAPPVFHMPVQVRLTTTAGDTMLNIPVTSSAQSFLCVVGDSVTGIAFDPDEWILKTANVYYGVEEAIARPPSRGSFRIAGSPSRRPILEYSGFNAGPVVVRVFDANGRQVSRISEEARSNQNRSIRMPDLCAGVYFVKFETPGYERTLKMIVVR